VPVALVLVVGWFVFSESLRGPGAPLIGASALARPGAELFWARGQGLAKLVLWSPFALLPLAVVGAVHRWSDRVPRALTLSALSTLAGFALVKFDQGHGWGYRYFHSAYATLPLLACLALSGRAAPGQSTGLCRAVFYWCLAGFFVLLPQRAWQVHDFIASHRAQLVKTPSDRECVHFVRPFGESSVDLVANRPDLRGDIFLFHRGDTQVGQMVARYFEGQPPTAQNGTDVAYCVSLARYRGAALGVASR
jgi:hypothetical protein